MKATAVAPSNIAFIKYWGKSDSTLRLPANPSVSMNISAARTTTTVGFSEDNTRDTVVFTGEDASADEIQRVINHLDRIRTISGLRMFARVVTKNTFPKGTGIASSASGFAALTVAGCAAAGLRLPEKELTVLARSGSGSACRSIPEGFVEWVCGQTSEDSYAYSLYPHIYWDIRDVLCVIETEKKKISSTGGMEFASTSPYWNVRLKEVPRRIERIKTALKQKNFRLFGETTEEDCLSMHEVMNTQAPPIFYRTKVTDDCIKAVRMLRASGCPAYFTIDAGPNVHVICEGKNEERVLNCVAHLAGIQSVLLNKPSPGTRLVEEHLF